VRNKSVHGLVSYPGPIVPPSDSEQLRWFTEQVQPHESELRAYLRRKFPSLFDLDDLIQETYVRLFRAKREGRVAEARPYLFATARNTACDLFRRSKIISISALAEIDDLSVVEERAPVSEALDHEHELAILTEAIAALPDRCRQVLTLCKLYGMSHREVAQQLGISEHTVNAQIALGVMRCRNFLRSRGLLKERAE
jgi:RNA polymerase sigma-70 factor (ECF subfamily)